MFDQSVRILAHTEEVSLLFGRLYHTAAVRALAIYQLGLRPERLTGSTIHSLIGPLVNITLVIETLEDLLYLLLMILIGSTYELIIRNI